MGNAGSSSSVALDSPSRFSGEPDFKTERAGGGGASGGDAQWRELALGRLIEGLSSRDDSHGETPFAADASGGSLRVAVDSPADLAPLRRSGCPCELADRHWLCVWRLWNKSGDRSGGCVEDLLPLWGLRGLLGEGVFLEDANAECGVTAEAAAPGDGGDEASASCCIKSPRRRTSCRGADWTFADIDAESCYLILHAFAPREPPHCQGSSPLRRRGNRRRRQGRHAAPAASRPFPPDVLDEARRRVGCGALS